MGTSAPQNPHDRMTGDRPEPLRFPALPERPLVSVLMPAYNAAAFLEEAIASVMAQTFANWELLLLDDGSTDGTATIMERSTDPRIRSFSNASNEGYLRSCNTLFGQVKGHLVTFLDADDTCIPTRLERCVNAFRQDTDLGFLTTDFCRTDVSGRILSAEKHSPDYERYSTDPEYYPTVCCATIMLRKELLGRVGVYHPFFERLGGEDYHWLFRLSMKARGVHLNEQMYRYRSHPAQTHLRNSDPLKYFIEDIDKELRRQHIHLGKDGLEHWKELRERWTQHMTSHPHELAYRKATHELNHGRPFSALLETFRIISSAPLMLGSYRNTSRMAIHLLGRSRLLLLGPRT
jgi:glycosyltransferase involved in cell wall biosynthesis